MCIRDSKGMESPGFNGNVYAGTHEDRNVEHVALRWVMKRGTNLRGFEIELGESYGTVTRAGPVLVALMSERSVWHDMKLAKYFAARGKLTSVDPFIMMDGQLSQKPLVRVTSISSKH